MNYKNILIVIFALLLLSVVTVGISQLGTIFRNPDKENEVTITSSKSNTFDCSASVSLSNGETLDLDIPERIDHCIHLFSMDYSLDAKYAAFAVDATESGMQNNQIIVFFADKKDWVSVYEYGAATATEISFDRDNILFVTLSDGTITEKKQIVIPVIEENFNNVDPVTRKLQYSETFTVESVLR